jgi:hypothetical protein
MLRLVGGGLAGGGVEDVGEGGGLRATGVMAMALMLYMFNALGPPQV